MVDSAVREDASGISTVAASHEGIYASHLRSLVNGLNSYLDEHHFRPLSELRGRLNLANSPNPEAYERANYVHSLLFWDR